jgi:single-stranded DNA-binding protein
MNVNNVSLVGRLGHDVKKFNTAKGVAGAYLRIAVNEDKMVTWVKAFAYYGVVDVLDKLCLKKGEKIVVEGCLRHDKNVNLYVMIRKVTRI